MEKNQNKHGQYTHPCAWRSVRQLKNRCTCAWFTPNAANQRSPPPTLIVQNVCRTRGSSSKLRYKTLIVRHYAMHIMLLMIGTKILWDSCHVSAKKGQLHNYDLSFRLSYNNYVFLFPYWCLKMLLYIALALKVVIMYVIFNTGIAKTSVFLMHCFCWATECGHSMFCSRTDSLYMLGERKCVWVL